MITSQRILSYIKSNGQATGSELADVFDISDRAIRKQLSKLFENGEIYKIGKPPKVYYLIAKDSQDKLVVVGVAEKTRKQIEQKFLIITPVGEKKEGFEGFAYWCEKNNLPIKKTATEYLNTVAKYDKYKKGGLIDGSSKLKNTLDKINLDKTYYLDFYSIERFGKTRLGQLLLYAKQSYAELGAGGPEENPAKPVPKGYVEPNIEFFDRIIALVNLTNDGLNKFGILPEHLSSRNNTFKDALQFYRKIAVSELQNNKELLKSELLKSKKYSVENMLKALTGFEPPSSDLISMLNYAQLKFIEKGSSSNGDMKEIFSLVTIFVQEVSYYPDDSGESFVDVRGAAFGRMLYTLVNNKKLYDGSYYGFSIRDNVVEYLLPISSGLTDALLPSFLKNLIEGAL